MSEKGIKWLAAHPKVAVGGNLPSASASQAAHDQLMRSALGGNAPQWHQGAPNMGILPNMGVVVAPPAWRQNQANGSSLATLGGSGSQFQMGMLAANIANQFASINARLDTIALESSSQPTGECFQVLAGCHAQSNPAYMYTCIYIYVCIFMKEVVH